MSENPLNDAFIGVVTVNYGTSTLVINCLLSLEAERRSFPNLHIAIVDNLSPDNSLSLIQEAIDQHHWSSWVKLVAAPVNGGYAYGNNLGFETIRSWLPNVDYFWMLNPDTEVLPGATQSLVNALVLNSNTIVGSCLQDRDGTKQISTFNFPSITTEICSSFRLGMVDKLFSEATILQAIPKTLKETGWLAGASLMLSSEVQSKLGGLDEGYFLYYEEVDYLLKARRMGIHSWYVPDSHVIHEVGAATGISDSRKVQKRRPKYWFESRRRYFMKNHGRLYLTAADLCWLAGYGTWILRKFFTNKKELELQPPFFWWDFAKESQLNPMNWFVRL